MLVIFLSETNNRFSLNSLLGEKYGPCLHIFLRRKEPSKLLFAIPGFLALFTKNL